MQNSGMAHMGIGIAKGDKGCIEAVKQAVESPLLETTIDGAKGVLIHIVGGNRFTLNEFNEGCMPVQEVVDPDAIIIVAMSNEEDMGDTVRATVIATGFGWGEYDLSGQSPAQKPSGRPFGQPAEPVRPEPAPVVEPEPVKEPEPAPVTEPEPEAAPVYSRPRNFDPTKGVRPAPEPAYEAPEEEEYKPYEDELKTTTLGSRGIRRDTKEPDYYSEQVKERPVPRRTMTEEKDSRETSGYSPRGGLEVPSFLRHKNKGKK